MIPILVRLNFTLYHTMQKIITLILLSGLFFSCQDTLTEKKAKNAIIKKEGYPKPYQFRIEKIYSKGVIKEWPNTTTITYTPGQFDNIYFFQDQGLLTVRDTGFFKMAVELTAKGKKHVDSVTSDTYYVRLWDFEFNKIESIVLQKRIKDHIEFAYKTVTYTLKPVNITPFGERFSFKNSHTGEYEAGPQINRPIEERFILDKKWKIDSVSKYPLE